MPAFYDAAASGQLPLTPPYASHYETQAQHYSHDSYGHPSVPQRLDSVVGYHRYPATVHQSYDQQTYCGGPQTLPPISAYHGRMGAPTLPPLRMQYPSNPDREYYTNSTHASTTGASQQQQPAPKEEQTTGGVSATLDYEMELMADFVSEKAQGMYALFRSNICLADIDIHRSMQPGSIVHPRFRKWVAQVLAATRLPSATILLSLHYLTHRIQTFPKTIDGSETQLYHLLAVSMVLGSKFLDDNTFINRSWSDVTSIKVSDLNRLEREWLRLIEYDLHVDPSQADGLTQWITSWKDFEIHAKRNKLAKLTPLDTTSTSRPLNGSRPSFTPGFAKSTHGTFTPLSSGSVSSAGTPYTSSDPWNHHDRSATEHWSMRPRYPPIDSFDYSARYSGSYMGHSDQYSQYQLPPLHTVAPSFYSPWNNTHNWEHRHGYGCHCVACSRQSSAYLMSSHFLPQTVVG